MLYTMRSAYKRWLLLHEEKIKSSFGSAPIWFEIEIRKRSKWVYINFDGRITNGHRITGGTYQIEINDDALFSIERPEFDRQAYDYKHMNVWDFAKKYYNG